jgi:hypothetical protein
MRSVRCFGRPYADGCGRELGLPACDVLRHGPEKLAEAVLQLRQQLNKSAAAAR